MTIKYKGILAKRRPNNRMPRPLAIEATQWAWTEESRRQDEACLKELHKFYQVTPGDWEELAMALARAHVHGFQVEKAARGPALVWNWVTRVQLWLAVESLMKTEEKAHSISHACKILARREPYISMLRKGQNPTKALWRQYDLADPTWVLLGKAASMPNQI